MRQACDSTSALKRSTQKTTDFFSTVMQSFSLSHQSRPVSRSLSPLPDDVSLLSLFFFKSSTTDCTKLSSPPRSPLPTHLPLPSSLEPLHHCHPPLYLVGQLPSTPRTHTRRQTHAAPPPPHTHTVRAYLSLICTPCQKIILLFFLRSLSTSLTHTKWPSLSLSVDVVERLDSLWDAWTHSSLGRWGGGGGCVISAPL